MLKKGLISQWNGWVAVTAARRQLAGVTREIQTLGSRRAQAAWAQAVLTHDAQYARLLHAELPKMVESQAGRALFAKQHQSAQQALKGAVKKANLSSDAIDPAERITALLNLAKLQVDGGTDAMARAALTQARLALEAASRIDVDQAWTAWARLALRMGEAASVIDTLRGRPDAARRLAHLGESGIELGWPAVGVAAIEAIVALPAPDRTACAAPIWHAAHWRSVLTALLNAGHLEEAARSIDAMPGDVQPRMVEQWVAHLWSHSMYARALAMAKRLPPRMGQPCADANLALRLTHLERLAFKALDAERWTIALKTMDQLSGLPPPRAATLARTVGVRLADEMGTRFASLDDRFDGHLGDAMRHEMIAWYLEKGRLKDALDAGARGLPRARMALLLALVDQDAALPHAKAIKAIAAP